MIILHFHLQPQFKNELFHMLHIKDFYVDDFVKSVRTVSEASSLAGEVTCFCLAKHDLN